MPSQAEETRSSYTRAMGFAQGSARTFEQFQALRAEEERTKRFLR